MDFSLERAKATAIKNMNFSNDSREDLASMAEELYEKYDEIDELKKKITKLEKKNEKLKEDVVNEDIRWGLVGTKINYSWLWTTMTERYDGDDEYDFEQDITDPETDQSIGWKEYGICTKLGNQIEKHINWGKGEEIEHDVNDAISELAELYVKKE